VVLRLGTDRLFLSFLENEVEPATPDMRRMLDSSGSYSYSSYFMSFRKYFDALSFRQQFVS
jgi:hypothetical protein